MIKKAHVLGLLAAALAIAPTAALAGDQVQGSSSNTIQTSETSGINNVTGQSSSTRTIQRQGQRSNPFCNSGNQIQASAANTGQDGLTVGIGNVTAQGSATDTYQRQVAKAQGYFCN
jgi:hypothetical protein